MNDSGELPTLRIAMVSLHTSPLDQPGRGDAGGLNVYVRQLATALHAADHHVEIFTRGEGDPDFLSPEIPVHYLPAGPPGPLEKERLHEHLDEFGRALCAATHGHFDVIHTHYWMSADAALCCRDSFAIPIVHTMHTMGRVKLHDHPESSELQERLDAEDNIVDLATRLTANTPAERAELVRFYNAPLAKIDVVPPGVNLEIFNPHGDRAIWPSASSSSALKVLFAGRIQEFKGPQVLFNALLLAKTKSPNASIHAVFIGDNSGPEQLNLPQMVERHHMHDAVSLLPAQPPERLADWFRAADIVAVPSFSESFGLVAMEAQACGTPVIAHASGGLAHTVLDNVTGALIKDLDPNYWADKLVELESDGIPETWSQNAAAHARDFSWERTATSAVASYRRATQPTK
ncbi:glycosyltransferase [Neomicrococcus lactis]|uniref:glycosyltransferase n=1 Tax=Neomicrococcus lactis TaxID=732241 RepID=UPI002300FA2E|nr:glycosyltransferase [Neomicrococcus lactis]